MFFSSVDVHTIYTRRLRHVHKQKEKEMIRRLLSCTKCQCTKKNDLSVPLLYYCYTIGVCSFLFFSSVMTISANKQKKLDEKNIMF